MPQGELKIENVKLKSLKCFKTKVYASDVFLCQRMIAFQKNRKSVEKVYRLGNCPTSLLHDLFCVIDLFLIRFAGNTFIFPCKCCST